MVLVMDKAIRQRVVELLKREGSLSAGDIGERLQLATVTKVVTLAEPLRETLWEMLKNDELGLDGEMRLKL